MQQLSWEHFVAGVGLIFAAMFAWFGALWLNLQGLNLWFVRLCIFLLLGLIIVAVVWWLHTRQKNKGSAPAAAGSHEAASSPGAGAADDVLSILREAEARLASSTQLPRGTGLTSLPVIFLLGETGVGKTCVAAQSGLEPELLSGQIYQEGTVAPTRLANLWFARKAVLLEMGGKTLGDAGVWGRVLRHLSPGKLRSLFSSKPAAPLAAVVCFNSEKLVKAASAEEITAQSRALRARLEQISQTLGISFPVYVLFTRADRLTYFSDFFRNLSEAETSQVLGTTLPPLQASATGVYAEQETKRLTAAFHSLFYSLAECRPGLLYRERSADKLAGIYEFPRELQKRIALATQFLVDLCRPSHLRSGPFLRGFYFTGVREVETAGAMGSGTVMAAKTSLMPARAFSANATSILRVDEAPAAAPAWQSATLSGGPAGESRRTTQWLFLTHIFSHIILQDHTALGASGASSRANIWKRAALATVGALACIWIIGMMVSYFGNRALEKRVRRAAEAILPIKMQAAAMAPLEDLQRLDAARAQLQKLEQYHRNGAPLRLHWGLYSGEALYGDFRQLYFDRFKKLVFGDVQTQMGSFLRMRPGVPVNPSDDDYRTTYDILKAYLMTTINPERSDTAFLAPFLLNRWTGAFNSDEQKRLTLEQFKYYADELRIENPFPANDDPLARQAVQQSRQYLLAFTGTNLVYRNYIAKLHKGCNCGPLDFSKKYGEASGVVREPKVVDAAFTKTGWKYMQNLLSSNDWNNDDEWVLGTAQGQARGINTADVRRAYESEYIREWRDYVKSASVTGLGGPSDASKKLERLTGNRSPLFELLCEVSENTAGTSDAIARAFQPVSDVVKAPCYDLVTQDSSKSYVAALSDFKLCIDQYQDNPANPATQREDAYKSCRVQRFPVITKEAANAVRTVDHEADLDKCVVSLLKLEACAVVRAAAPPPVEVDPVCTALNRLSTKYPFRPDSNDEATPEDFMGIFQPGSGLLSQAMATGGPRGMSRANLDKLKKIQAALYPHGGSAAPEFHFSVVSATIPTGTKSAHLNLDGKTLNLSEGGGSSQDFVWSANDHEAELRFSDTALGPFAGSWAVFRLLGSYTWAPRGAGMYHLESPPLKNQGVTFKDLLEVRTAVPLFSRGYLSQLRCGK